MCLLNEHTVFTLSVTAALPHDVINNNNTYHTLPCVLVPGLLLWMMDSSRGICLTITGKSAHVSMKRRPCVRACVRLLLSSYFCSDGPGAAEASGIISAQVFTQDLGVSLVSAAALFTDKSKRHSHGVWNPSEEYQSDNNLLPCNRGCEDVHPGTLHRLVWQKDSSSLSIREESANQCLC